MLNAGRSWSGHERNCCFLNTGSNAGSKGRFATISATSGLDFADDARAFALVDWDHDGRLDVWIANRNAPQLRLMRNQLESGGGFVALRLAGNGRTTNRDAIGARVEIVVPGKPPQIKTLRAGEGFLSQSSKWLHFGLGSATEIERVVVRWPGGAKETFRGIQPNRHYAVAQGTGRAEPWRPEARTRLVLKAGASDSPAPSQRARVAVITPLLITPEAFKSTDGSLQELPVGRGNPVLVNFWASWCRPCLEELKQFTDRADELRAADIEVVALSVDGLEDGSKTLAAQAVLDRLKFPFQAGAATRELVKYFQTLHDLHIPLTEPLPVPTSFLIDRQGRLVMIYKGPVSVEQILRDARQASGTRSQRVARAAPLSGRTIDDPVVAEPIKWDEIGLLFGWARELHRLGRFEQAERAYRAVLAEAPDNIASQINLGALLVEQKRLTDAEAVLRKAQQDRPDSAEVRINLGLVLRLQKRIPEAIEQYREAVRLAPDSADIRRRLGEMLLSVGNPREARVPLEKAVLLDPTSVVANHFLGVALAEAGHPEEAVARFRAAIRYAPNFAQSHYQLALLLRQAGDLSGAEKHFRETIRITPNSHQARYELATTLKRQGNPAGAVAELRRAC
jgi:tetratricopeptide (TPR) repeat protein